MIRPCKTEGPETLATLPTRISLKNLHCEPILTDGKQVFFSPYLEQSCQ